MSGRLSGSSAAITARNPALGRLFFQSRAGVITLDFALVALGVLASYIARFEGLIPSAFFRQMLIAAPLLALARVSVNAVFGVYRMVWRYVGLHEAFRMAQAVAVVSLVLLAFRLLAVPYLPHLSIPLSIIVMEGMFSFLAMAGARFVPRILRERVRAEAGVATLLIGAGQGGLAIVKEAARHPDLRMRPIGFIDDDPTKHGMAIAGLRILGTIGDLARVIRTTGTERVIITSSSFGPKGIQRVMDACVPLGVEVRIVQGVYERLGEPAADAGDTARGVRELRIEDLLSRDPVPPSLSLADLVQRYSGKRVMVTGAGGSIGSELCRQLAHMRPAQVILAERDETNLFEIERELIAARLGGITTPVLLDCMDGKQVERAFKEFQPQVVFHAAAYKHVPMMERFPWEAVRNNVFATKQLIELADEHGVESFVMISTDKAINPTSVMGATKRFAEQIVQEFATRATRTRFSCVRFGNVLGSRGSVVGIFQEQIATGGPVTVTHPDATRYFMTIPEAANLVIQAGTLGDRGEVFLLDMGEPVKIIDLARQMIRLSGFTEKEIPIKVVGTRPGEKLFEELSAQSENLAPTELRKIFRCRPVPVDGGRVSTLIERLQFVVRGRDGEGVRALLAELDIGYQPPTPSRSSDVQ